MSAPALQRFLLWAIVGMLAARPQDTRAQDAPFHVPRLTGPVVIDGHVDEAAWLAIPPLGAVSMSPVFNVTPSERTEFRLAYDDKYLYVSGRFFDSDPKGIRATSLRRDDSALSNDWLVVNLDTFMDRQTALVFGITPSGVRTEAIFPNDAESGTNFGWNTFWAARSSLDAEGWSGEIQIPLSSLRFEVQEGRVVMGITLWRNIARKNEIITWPTIEPRWGFNSVVKASQTRPVVLEGVRRLNPVYFTPYALSGPSRRNGLDANKTAYITADDWARDVGLDVKVSPSSNLAVDLTLNTDFAQVEADDQQVNLTRFSLFFPERRLFFQERGELFEFAMGGSDRLFYSRRIGLVNGVPTRIYGGARATGRIGGWDFGFLDLQTAASGSTGSENSGVVRLRRRVLNKNSYVGALATSRIESDGASSFSAGADALLNPRGANYLSLAVASTQMEGDSADAAERLFARARWERRGVYGLGVDAEVAHVGGEFQPALGFLARRDHARVTGSAGWGWRMPKGSSLLRQRVSAGFRAYRGYEKGRLESGEVTPAWYLETPSGHSLTFTGALRYEDLADDFTIATGLTVPAGTYTYGSGRVAYAPSTSGLLRFSASAEAGSFFDGSIVSTSVTPTWNTSRHLELSGNWQVNRVVFSDRDEKRTTHTARLRALLMVNTQLSSVAVVQLNSASDLLLLNFRLRYNPREGNDLYVVYNHGLNSDRFSYSPVRPLTDNRTLLVKYSHTFRLER